MVDVPFFSQEDYPTGCELVSTSMLLAYYGHDITADELINGGYVGMVKITHNKKGVAYGGDPNEVFVGDPFDENGYGCFSGAVIGALRKILPEDRYEVLDLGGTSLSCLCTDYVSRGIPVLVWVSIGMQPTYRSDRNVWRIKETGEVFQWTSREHCAVLVGDDRSFYYFNDPLVGKQTLYGRELSEQRYAELGMQAVAVMEK